MAGILNNLYPPIVSTYMPAFVRTSACNVYFSLSAYNDASDIANVQVMISNQNSTLSALKTSLYPSGIKITDLKVNSDIDSDEKYYITIDPSDLKDGEFEVGQYYKVQLRFTSTAASAVSSSAGIALWLTENQGYFSEWSTVCLIKGIEQPQIYLKNFSEIDDTSDDIVFTTSIVDIIGNMYYEENDTLEDEYLKYYIIEIYTVINDNQTLFYNSGIIYTNEFYPNEINYTINANLESGTTYLLKITYVTNNEYSDYVEYTFSSLDTRIGTLDATISAEADEDNGRIAVSVISTTTESFLGNLCIRRSSSETNFSVWEDIKIEVLQDNQILNYTFYDYTVQGGIFYSYCAQTIDIKGNRGVIISLRNPVMVYLDNIFLTEKDFQLKIKYNPIISSFKTTYLESKTDTIGSKYPYIRRNGNVAYKTFSISGLITAFCDEDNIFTSREDFYGDNLSYYDNFNSNEQITEYKDFVYEKFFRDKVIDFLYKNNVKLFRSLTEGNILVRLMDISFTPQTSLGRMLYNFTATAYEIDECNLENYKKYNIITIGEYSSLIQYSFYQTGQLNETISANTNILTFLQTKYEEFNVASGYYNTVNYITWLRIDFQDDPYLIKCNSNGTLTKATSSTTITEDIVYGYIAYINGKVKLISPRGYYELDDDDTVVTSVYFPYSTEVIIDYTVQIDQFEDISLIASKFYNYTKVGQLWGIFDVNDNIYRELYLKYYIKYPKEYYTNLISIDSLRVEGDPGTIVYIKDSFDDDWYRHEIGSTGQLLFYDEETTIEGFYFYGRHLNKMSDYPRLEFKGAEYQETGITATTFSKITEPVENGVYTITSESSSFIEGNTRFIYYQENWYDFTEDDIVLCPVNGVIDYIVETVKGEY